MKLKGTRRVRDIAARDNFEQIEGELTLDAWRLPTFQNSWTNKLAGDRIARYYKAGGRCYLEGIIGGGVIGQAAFTLPAGYRPTHLEAAGFGTAHPVVSNGVFGLVLIQKDGRVVPAAPSSNVYVDLSSISFRCE